MSKDWGWHFTNELAKLLAENTGMAQGERVDRKRVAKELINQVILSHAPVIDAEKLAEKMIGLYAGKYDSAFFNDVSDIPPIKNQIKEFAQLISDSIDLNLVWADGKAKWGGLTLECLPAGDDSGDWEWEIDGTKCPIKHGSGQSESNVKQACATALRKILTGVKE